MSHSENIQPPGEPMEVDDGDIFGNQPDWLDELAANHTLEELTEGNIVVHSIHVAPRIHVQTMQAISNVKRG